jgi:hypothetical protein
MDVFCNPGMPITAYNKYPGLRCASFRLPLEQNGDLRLFAFICGLDKQIVTVRD